MTAPQRIQRKRTKGWRMPEGAVYVGRPTVLGNPFWVSTKVPAGHRFGDTFCVPTVEDAVECYREMLTCPGERADAIRAAIPELRGKTLACFCPLDQPCHADVLLELANAPDAAIPEEAQ